ncbi:MAG: AAA family ATPase [Deltaproteobacteria bacterium]|nr:MAG: AAA family ATPase [Deltaproteobacteria bacterium]
MTVKEQIATFAERVERLRNEVSRVLVGQRKVVDGVITCLVADGHVLLEGVPGLGKTLLVRTLSECLSMSYARVQFTPDLMPADIVGTHILEDDPHTGTRKLVFREGPVFTQLLLADEINRATPKTQSALLEAMAERQVTITGRSRPLPKPFFVMATQNPLEMEGTYPLPEAQLDRFFFKVDVPFPNLDDLVTIMDRTTTNATQSVKAVLQPSELAELRGIVREVVVAPEVMRYAMRLVLGTHPDSPHATPSARRFVRYGASPRGAQAIVLGARTHALFEGRAHASIADVRAIAHNALRHRLGRNFDAEAEGLSTDDLVSKILDELPEAEGRVARELGA